MTEPLGDPDDDVGDLDDTDARADVTATDETPNTTEPESASSEADALQAEDSADYDDEDVSRPRMSHTRLAIALGLVVVVALAGLTGWLGFRAYQLHQSEKQSQVFLQVGRQAALNLTTIDWQHAESDVQRVLDSATGTFHDDFQQRSQPFIDVVKKAQSKSIGTITEAGLESESKDDAQVLVAVAVKTSNAGAAEPQPRAWRMRISVHKIGNDVKVSNVEFVP